DWSVMWRFQYLGGFRMGWPASSEDVQPAGRGLAGLYIQYGAYIRHRRILSYTVGPFLSLIILAVEHLLGKQPPILYSNNVNNGNTDAFNFDQLGRSYWLRWTTTFK